MRHAYLCLCIVLLSLQSFAEISFEEKSQIVDEYLNKQVLDGFSGQIRVRQKGKYFSKGYGFAIKETKKMVEENTIFDIGSVTKQFVGAAFLILEEETPLNLSDPISMYLDVPEDKKSITVADMLSHRSGLGYPDFSDPDIDWEDFSKHPKKFYEFFFEKAPVKDAGKFQYNNMTYSTLAWLIAEVSGQSYESFVKEKIFDPAQMSFSGFNTPDSVDLELSAMGYDKDGKQLLAGQLYNGIGYEGATGAVTNCLDLEKWIDAITNNTVLSEAQKEKLFHPHTIMDKNSAYGLGWFVSPSSTTEPLSHFEHSGSTIGFSAQLSYFINQDLMFAFLTNTYDKARHIWKVEAVFRSQLSKEEILKELNK